MFDSNQKLKTLFAALAVVGLLTANVTAASGTPIVFGDDSPAPNPSINGDVTKDTHDASEMSVLEYEGDNGDVKELPASLNSSADNPVSFFATDIELADFGEFPRKSGETDNSASALDASEWTKSGQNKSSMSITDTKTAPGVNAVSVATSGYGSGDYAQATYANVSLTEDANKRVLQIAADVQTLDSGANVQIQIMDEDGTYKTVYIDPAKDATKTNVIANTTGEGKLTQVRIGQLQTNAGPGDSTFDGINQISVFVNGGDADVDMSLINAESYEKYTFGERQTDDGTETVTDAQGEISVTSLDTAGSTFDNAVYHDLTLDLKFSADDLASSDIVQTDTEASNYPTYDKRVDVYYKLELPAAYDLSYSNVELGVDSKKLPGSRYTSVEMKEGVGDTDLTNIDYSDDVTSTFDGSAGETITLDSTVQPGQEIGIHFEILLTGGEYSAMTDTGVTAGPVGQSETPFGSIPVVGGVFAALAGLWAKLTN